MSEYQRLTDIALEKIVRRSPDGVQRSLLRLLDAERARADAAEAKVADVWDEGARAATMDYGIGKATNPYRKA